jgi:hypothetical protein
MRRPRFIFAKDGRLTDMNDDLITPKPAARTPGILPVLQMRGPMSRKFISYSQAIFNLSII